MHTLADYFRQHDAEVTTLRAGFPAIMLDEIAPDLVVLSPGPGRPADFKCDELLTELDARRLPVFGVCLGLQAMVEHAGGELSLLPEPQHGKPGRVQVRDGHDSALFGGLPQEFTAARYHSLYVKEPDVKGGFTVTAVTRDGVVMAIEDDAAGRWAVQFHPESILTAAGRSGHQVIANVLASVRARSGHLRLRAPAWITARSAAGRSCRVALPAGAAGSSRTKRCSGRLIGRHREVCVPQPSEDNSKKRVRLRHAPTASSGQSALKAMTPGSAATASADRRTGYAAWSAIRLSWPRAASSAVQGDTG